MVLAPTLPFPFLMPLLQDVSVRTVDGKVLTGALKARSLAMETDFGSAEIDASEIASIDFGPPDVVRTRGGLELTGELTLRSLRLATETGTKTLRRDDLASLVALDEGAAEATGFSGRWSGSFGPMELRTSGNEVTGTYGWENESEIEGEVDGDELTFAWRNRNGNRGTGTFHLWKDGRTFTGTSSAPGGAEEFWGGYRLAPRRAEPRPGEVTEGQTESMLGYHLRVPEDFDASRKWTAIALFHGSNMSARAYVDTFAAAWPELAERYVLVGFDGERLSPASRDGRRAFNATYVNFEGEDERFPLWKRSETPALVAHSLEELASFLPIERWFVGGHSQGGFLTYAVAMFYPELVAGAFPVSCNLLIQCEPSYFEDEDRLREAQRRIPFAHVHGENDGVVDFAGGLHCYEALQDGGFPMIRLFTDLRAAHMFARLPVDRAVTWLERMTSRDAGELADLAEESLEDDEPRDACAAARRALELEPGAPVRDRVAKVLSGVDAAADAEAEELERAIAKNADGGWVADFWEFRRRFALSARAAPVLAAYAKLRAKHQPEADELFWKARAENDDAERNRMRREIVERWYACSYYPMVSRWLE